MVSSLEEHPVIFVSMDMAEDAAVSQTSWHTLSASHELPSISVQEYIGSYVLA
jgi:hypothetical protein